MFTLMKMCTTSFGVEDGFLGSCFVQSVENYEVIRG